MSTFDLDIKSVEKLASLLKETGLSEIEYAEGDKRIRCVAAQTVVQVAAPQLAAPQPAAATAVAETVGKAVSAGNALTAPMVGTAYLAPEPGAAPFVKVGDRVKAGDTLLIIEAMKVMNPIKATAAGTVEDILVSDAQPVEFGEPLIVIA